MVDSAPPLDRNALAAELLANLEFAVKLLTPLFGHTAQIEHMQTVIDKAKQQL